METLLILLAAGGLLLRLLSASADVGRSPPVIRLAMLVLAAAGGWALATAAGWWTPWWPTVAVALAGMLASSLYAGRALRPALDASVMLWLGWLAVPAASWTELGLLAAGYALVGMAADTLLGRFLPVTRKAVSVAGTLALAVATPLFLLQLSPSVAPHWHQLLSVGVMDSRPGSLERLPSGGALWLEETCSDRVALVLHGNNPLGSRQHAAGPLRRALLARCFTVASLDHLGYGATPPPAASTPLEGWDPLPNILEAKAFLAARYPQAELVLLGHSMGSNDALRVIGGHNHVNTIVLLGSALSDPPERDEYWFSRFTQARDLDETAFSMETFLSIRENYYDPATSAAGLGAGHPPLVFVRFEHEWDNLIAQRDALFEMLPGRKLLADFTGTTHYLNAAGYRARVVFADVGSGRRLANEVGRWLDSAADLEPQQAARADGL